MSPTSYQTAPPRIYKPVLAGSLQKERKYIEAVVPGSSPEIRGNPHISASLLHERQDGAQGRT
jgi:hypothetical protein